MQTYADNKLPARSMQCAARATSRLQAAVRRWADDVWYHARRVTKYTEQSEQLALSIEIASRLTLFGGTAHMTQATGRALSVRSRQFAADAVAAYLVLASGARHRG